MYYFWNVVAVFIFISAFGWICNSLEEDDDDTEFLEF
jgi:hypothetical protein